MLSHCLLISGNFTIKKTKKEPIASNKTRELYGSWCSQIVESIPGVLEDCASVQKLCTADIRALLDGDKKTSCMQMSDASMNEQVKKFQKVEQSIEELHKAVQALCQPVTGLGS